MNGQGWQGKDDEDCYNMLLIACIFIGHVILDMFNDYMTLK